MTATRTMQPATCDKLALLAVGEEVMLLDGRALARDHNVAGETAPDEGRTKPRTMVYRQLSMAL